MQSDARWEPPETPMLLARLRWRPQPTTRWLIVPDQPVPEAAVEAERIARAFHEEYERLAPAFGYRTREESAKPWEEVPAQNRKLMVHTVGALLGAGMFLAVPQDEQGQRELVERQGDWLSDYFGGCASEECTHDTVEDCKASRPWDHTARGFLQALDLLPEQEAER